MPAPGVVFLPQGKRRGPPILVRQVLQAGPVTTAVNVTTDDGYGDSFSSSVSTSSIFTGVETDRTLRGFVRLQNVQMAQGAVVLTATLVLNVQNVYTSPSLNISASAEDNAAAISTYANLTGRTATTAHTTWVPVFDAATTERQVDVTAVVQEVVNRAGWVRGNSILFLFDSTIAQGTVNEVQVYDYTTSPALAARLDIVPSTAGSNTWLLDAAATATGTGTAAIDVVKTLQAAGTATGTGTTTITKTSTLAAAATATGTGTTTITITHTLDATSTATGTGTAAIAKTSTLQVAGTATGTGTAAIDKTSTLAAAATATGTGTAALDKTTALAAAATATGTGTTTIAKTSVLDVAAVATATGTTTLAKTSTLDAAGVATGSAVASMGINLDSAATATAHGTATLSVFRDTSLTTEAEPGTTRGDGFTVPPLSQLYNVNRFGRTYLNRRK